MVSGKIQGVIFTAMDFYFQMMQRCIELAGLGLGNVAPNPLVGCVIVHDGKVIGEGYHEKYGGPHAEVNAISAVTDPQMLKSATLFVNLEPCAHHGKTPPCADLIIDKKIPHVVIGCTDPFEAVAGKGITRLRAAGVQVTTDVLREESRFLNRRFFVFHEQKRPYIILKWAQTMDGFIDIIRSAGEKGIHWISGATAKTLVHKWRSEEMAILVGKRTVQTDDPELTVREVEGKNPLRLVIDPSLSLNLHHKIFSPHSKTIVLNDTLTKVSGEFLEYLHVSDLHDGLDGLLSALYHKGVQSVIIEGGRYTLDQFIDSGCWDEARVIVSETTFGNGLKAPDMSVDAAESMQIGCDRILTYYR